MKTTSAIRKFFLVYLLLHLATSIAFLVIASRWISRELEAQSTDRLKSIAVVVKNQLASTGTILKRPSLREEILALGKDLAVRLTIIDWNGEVLADSESPAHETSFENHNDRPEIQGARRDGFGVAYRKSESVERKLYYVAIRFDSPNGDDAGGFIRVASDQEAFFLGKNTLLRFLWLSVLSLAGLSAFAMWRFTKREMEPLRVFSQTAHNIAAGQFEPMPLALSRDDEWRTLSEAFRQMQTELGLREKRLLENTHRLEAVLSSMIEGVLAIDASRRVILANEAACNILGIDHKQLLSRNLLEIVRVPLLRQAIEETQSRKTFSRVEFQTLSDPRKKISARVCIMDNEPTSGVAIVLHDVTEIRQLETMRRDFVANVSHELKTPLSSIKAYAETLKMGAIHDQDKNLYFLHQIETQAELLSQQIQDLLTLAKVESGQATLKITNFLVAEICEQAVEEHMKPATSRSIDLKYQTNEPNLLVRADAEELMTVLNNLLSNAIRYTPENGRVELSSYAENNTAVIQVTDSGIGIAPEHLSRIFERFYRVDRARSREMGGTGLGLAIVKHLTQTMGGSVHVESQPGKGSTFRIKLPLGKSD